VSDDLYEQGLKIRKAVLGEEYVNRALASVNDLQQASAGARTEYLLGKVWGRPASTQATQHAKPGHRSVFSIARIELKAHIRGALTNGVTPEEICEILQVMIYAACRPPWTAFRVRTSFRFKSKQPQLERAGHLEIVKPPSAGVYVRSQTKPHPSTATGWRRRFPGDPKFDPWNRICDGVEIHVPLHHGATRAVLTGPGEPH